MSSAAIYPGTFDPITLGHLDLIERSAYVFERVVLAVAAQSRKDVLFSAEERVSMAREVTADYGNVEVDVFDGLLVDYAKRRGISVVVRGMRVYSDFEFEFQMALTNRKLAPDITTLFMMPKEDHSYVSSSIVREIAELGGDTSDFVPERVQRRLAAKFGGR